MQSITNKKSFWRSFRHGFNNVTVKDFIIALLIGLALGGFFGVFFLNIIANEALKDQHAVAVNVLKHSSQAEQNFENTFKILNFADFKTCNEHNMEMMRDLLFQKKYIKNIGFIVNGKVVCSAARGHNEHPMGVGPLVKHQKPNGTVVMPKRMLQIFGGSYRLDIFRQGNYSIL